ncbi:hypothetical protein CKA32_003697 [Geitlerinema sp. FC II]|nr:hypothetical protein CKA32_003697 [Geitlerinema sp. FC II]
MGRNNSQTKKNGTILAIRNLLFHVLQICELLTRFALPNSAIALHFNLV